MALTLHFTSVSVRANTYKRLSHDIAIAIAGFHPLASVNHLCQDLFCAKQLHHVVLWRVDVDDASNKYLLHSLKLLDFETVVCVFVVHPEPTHYSSHQSKISSESCNGGGGLGKGLRKVQG